MGNASSSNSHSNANVCKGKDAPGLNQHCYTTGYDHARPNISPDAVGEALGAAPCLTNVNANKCYTQGFQDGHSSSDSARVTRHNGTLSNGDVYNNGKLVAARGSNGLTYTIRRPGPRG